MLNPKPSQLAGLVSATRIEFDSLPSRTVLSALEAHLCANPDTLVRFFGRAGDWTTLEFLHEIPSVRRLLLDNMDIRNPIASLEPLRDVRELRELNIPMIAKRKVDFTPLLGFAKTLRSLSIWIEKRVHSDYFDVISQLPHLSDLGVPYADFEVIARLKRIAFLNLGSGPFTNTNAVTELTSLNRIRCYRTNIDDLPSLLCGKRLRTVEFLHMPKIGIERLPEDAALSFLYLDGFKCINSFETLTTYPRLKTLIIRNCHLPPSHFAFLEHCPALERVFIEYQSRKEQRELETCVSGHQLLSGPLFPDTTGA